MLDNKLIELPENIKSNSILVLDNDFISFKIASVLESKSVKVYDDDKYIGKFKHRTEYKNSDKFNPSFEIKDEQILKNDYKSSMAYLFNHFIQQYKKETNTKEVILVGGGDSNFRDRIPLPAKYKGNRDGALRPLSLKECKEFGKNNYIYDYRDDLEADDVCSMYQFRSWLDKDNYIVVCSPDKDQLQVNGNLYIPEKRIYNIDGLGSVGLKQMSKRQKLIFEGRKALYAQAGLIGDPTDNYMPCDWYKISKGVSKKSAMITDLKAHQMLKDCQTDKECLDVVYQQYLDWYPNLNEWVDWQGNTVKGDVIDLMQKYFEAAFMLRWPEDSIDIRTILKSMDII